MEQLFSGTTTTPLTRLERRSRDEEIAAAERALVVLDELISSRQLPSGTSAELTPRQLFDPRLLATKEILKPYPPVRVLCPCGHSLDWIAIAPLSDHGLQLSHGPRLVPREQRRGGAYDILSGVPRSPFGPTSAQGTVHWVMDAEAGVGNVVPEPDGPHGKVYALKAHYHCPRDSCRFTRTVLHNTLLRSWLTAVLMRERRIYLADVPGVAAASKSHVVRIPGSGAARAWSTGNRASGGGARA